MTAGEVEATPAIAGVTDARYQFSRAAVGWERLRNGDGLGSGGCARHSGSPRAACGSERLQSGDCRPTGFSKSGGLQVTAGEVAAALRGPTIPFHTPDARHQTQGPLSDARRNFFLSERGSLGFDWHWVIQRDTPESKGPQQVLRVNDYNPPQIPGKFLIIFQNSL